MFLPGKDDSPEPEPSRMERQGFGTSDKKPRNIDFFMEELKRESEARARRDKERAERGEEYVPRRREGGKVRQHHGLISVCLPSGSTFTLVATPWSSAPAIAFPRVLV